MRFWKKIPFPPPSGSVGTGGRKNKFLLTDDEKLKNNVENNLLNNNANLLKV